MCGFLFLPPFTLRIGSEGFRFRWPLRRLCQTVLHSYDKFEAGMPWAAVGVLRLLIPGALPVLNP